MYNNSTLTDASINGDVIPRQGEPMERMRVDNGLSTVYGGGFYNTGVRPTAEELCIGRAQVLHRAAHGLSSIVPFLGNDQTDF